MELMIFKVLTIVFISFLALSCTQKVRIEPAWQPVPLNNQLKGKIVNVSIPIVDGAHVPRFGQDFEEVPELGDIFRRLAGMFADITIDEESGRTLVPLEAYSYYFPELDQIKDFSIIRELALNGVRLEVSSAGSGEKVSLKFIEQLEVYLDFNDPVIVEEDENGDIQYPGKLILSYNSLSDHHKLGCLERCLDLNVHELDWKKVVEKERLYTLYIKLIVNSVPKSDMKIGGTLNVGLGFQTNF